MRTNVRKEASDGASIAFHGSRAISGPRAGTAASPTAILQGHLIMDREFSSKVENKPVDDRPGRAPPLPRGSGGRHCQHDKANNVLFFGLKNVPSCTQRAPTAIAPATQLEAVT